jgi:hypothetical protein
MLDTLFPQTRKGADTVGRTNVEYNQLRVVSRVVLARLY